MLGVVEHVIAHSEGFVISTSGECVRGDQRGLRASVRGCDGELFPRYAGSIYAWFMRFVRYPPIRRLPRRPAMTSG